VQADNNPADGCLCLTAMRPGHSLICCYTNRTAPIVPTAGLHGAPCTHQYCFSEHHACIPQSKMGRQNSWLCCGTVHALLSLVPPRASCGLPRTLESWSSCCLQWPVCSSHAASRQLAGQLLTHTCTHNTSGGIPCMPIPARPAQASAHAAQQLPCCRYAAG
jgi:hypothetical protein